MDLFSPTVDIFPIAVPMPGFRATGAHGAGNVAGIAELTIDDVRTEGDRTLVTLNVKNLQGGYQFSESVRAYIVGSDGLIYQNCESNMFNVEAGPSQSASLKLSFGVPSSVKDRYLVVTVGTNPAIGGVAFKLD